MGGHHDHHHAQPEGSGTGRFYLGIVLNIIFVVVEAGYGFATDSMALLADAGHNLSDVAGLILAVIAVHLGRRKPTRRFTYGLGRASILIAIVNGVLLLGASGAIAVEAAQRIKTPTAVPGLTIIIVAAIGVLINGFSTLLFVRGGKDDLNVRGAFLHMAADMLVSLGVVVAGVLMHYTGWLWLDPAISLVIVLVIVWSSWGLLRDSGALSLDAVPKSVSIDEVEDFLNESSGVESLHDLHVWAISTTKNALTVHIVSRADPQRLLAHLRTELSHKFGITHATVQVETEDLGCRCV